MMHGVIAVDKPTGPSSAQVVAKLKKWVKPSKIGHAGTLDPLATGALICLVGGATRLAKFAEQQIKRYSGIIRLGATSDSDDRTGRVTEMTGALPPVEAVLAARDRFLGPILQRPPAVSAIKIDGRRAYDLHRSGVEVDIPPRAVTVHRFELEALDAGRYSFEVDATAGTYIRSLARDLGEILRCGGLIDELRRVGSDPFGISDLCSVDDPVLLPWTRLFPAAPCVPVPRPLALKISNGSQSALAEFSTLGGLELSEGTLVVYSDADTELPLGLLRKSGGTFVVGVNVIGLEEVKAL